MKVCCVLLLTVCVTLVAAQRALPSSCAGRCGLNDGSPGCQCNTVCGRFGDCCSDYEAVCLTCADRCGEAYVAASPCHCNDSCASHSNCCADYGDLCSGSSGGSVTNADIKALTDELYGLDTNNLAASVSIDLQGTTTSGSTIDRAPDPLFSSWPALTGQTFVLFEALRNNYDAEESVTEDNNHQERAEVTAFLDAVMATPLMARLDQFMTAKQLLTGSLRANIEEVWFTLYSRYASVLGSSGFEHSFMGERNGQKVGGFHNWVSFLREEDAGNANYKGYIEYIKLGKGGYVVTDQFTWYEANKPKGGIIVGTSPEYELAVYTLCFFTRPNARCQVRTDGVGYFIQTWDLMAGGKTLVGSAYPGVN